MNNERLEGFTRFSDDEFGINDLNYDQSEQMETATFNKQNSQLFDGEIDHVVLRNNVVRICKERVSSSKIMDNELNFLYI
ncbi:MAG: hypothetical protein ACTTJ6_04255 [Treponema sp.]